MTARALGIAHLSLLDLTPPELVSTAAEAGFDFVGIRVHAATPGETPFPMAADSPMLRETRRRLDDTGLIVMDIEFLTLDDEADRNMWLPALESGAALGARTVSVVGATTDRSRLDAMLRELTDDARGFDITPTLEPISYQPVSTVLEARNYATRAGCAILIDPLHLARSESSLADVEDLPPALVPLLQLCDAPRALPAGFAEGLELPQGMTADGDPRKVEARALRDIPGDGELPLRELIAAVAPETPISVEVPNAVLRRTLSALEFARQLHQATSDIVHPDTAHTRQEQEHEKA